MPAHAHIARLAALVAAVALILPAAATAAPQDGNYDGQFRGVVQAGAQDRPTGNNDPRPASTAALPGDLTWHGGPVMHSNRTHVIYWEPTGHTTAAAYKALVNQYMSDVALASGRIDNVYAANTQYTDSTGAAAYVSTFAGSFVDANAYPSNGCAHPQALSICLTDPQIRSELNAFITANSLPRGMGDIYFVLTPQGVGSCFDSGAASCSYTKYCAYHSDFSPAGGRTIYAMQPWADVGACNVGDSPNANSAADNVINLISHEHNESITDPLGDGWWDPADGKENGDKCVWSFGTPLGGSTGAKYNQLINSNKYMLQREWSNASHSCVLTYDPPPNAVFTFSPTSPSVNQVVTFDGTGSSDVPGPISNYAWTFGDGATASGSGPAFATVTHLYSSPGTYAVTLTVTGSGAATTSVTHNVTVPGPPVAGSSGTPSTAPKFSPPPAATPAPLPPIATPAARPSLALPALVTRVTRNRRTALVRVGCGTAAPCSGSVTIYGRARAGRGTFRSLFLGVANFSLGAGRSAIVRVPLTLRAAGLLANGRRVSATVRASARGATPVSANASLRAS
jgi:hypothetical protein